MRTVSVQFTRPKGLKFPILSWIIRKVLKSEFSHVRLSWKSSSGIEIVYEASGTAVKLIGENAAPDFLVEIIHEYEVQVSQEEYRKLIRLFRFASVKYAISQLFGMLWAKMWNLRTNPVSKGRDAQVCSELILYFLKEVKGWEINKAPDLVDPCDIKDKMDWAVRNTQDVRKKV